MGYLTEVIIHIDALTAFREDPKLFGESVLAAIDKASRDQKQVSVSFKSYCNYISAEPCRHADHTALFLSKGNCVSVIGQYENDWEDFVRNNPNLAKDKIKEAENILKRAKKCLMDKKES